MSALTSPSFSKERFLNIMLKRIDTSSNDHKNSIFNTKNEGQPECLGKRLLMGSLSLT